MKTAAGRANPAWPIAMALVLIVYLWFFTAGHWITLPKAIYTNMYDQMATAFCSGQLHLVNQPSAVLLSLPDPYDPKERKDISYLGDATLYNNQYYLYWGPVPGLLLCGIKILISRREIGDQYFVFVSIVGTFVFLSLLIKDVKKRFFQNVPAHLFVFSLCLAGLANPFTWMLNSPDIYEAAIGCGQFFLIGGVYWIFSGLQENRAIISRIVPGAVFLALAVGTRFTQILPAAVITISALVWYYKRYGGSQSKAKVVLLCMTFVFTELAMVLALGWYNYARFGSFTEFGFRYQLAFIELNKHDREIFSALYIFPNLFNYLLNPFTVTQQFPYILPHYGSNFGNSPIPFPRLYFSETITGLLFTSPILLFGIYAVISAVRKRAAENSPDFQSLRWLKLSLALAVCANAATLLFFFYSAERYLAEGVGLLIPLSIIGIWEGYANWSETRVSSKFYLFFTYLVGGASITVCSLLAITSIQNRFLAGNPALIEKLASLLTR